MIRKTIITVLTLASILTLILGGASHWVWTSWMARTVPDYLDGCLLARVNNGTLSITYMHGDDPSNVGQRLDLGYYGLGIRSGTHSDEEYGTSSMTTVELPFWLAGLMLGAYPLVVFIKGPVRRWRHGKQGHCRQCGYDLTGNVTGVCSECGATLDADDIPPATRSAHADDSSPDQLRHAGIARKRTLIATSTLTISILLLGTTSHWIETDGSVFFAGGPANWGGSVGSGFTAGDAFVGYSHGYIEPYRDLSEQTTDRTTECYGLRLTETIPTIPGGLHGWDLHVPFWIPLVIFGLYPTLVLLRWLVRRRRARGSKAPLG